MRLEHPRTRSVRRRRRALRPLVLALEERALLTPTNVLVNNPAEDAGAQNTQSETSLLAYTNAAGQHIVIDGFNDSGSYNPSSAFGHFTGYSVSTDGGQTFADKGTLPGSTAGDAGDPILARDSTTGRVYLATLGFFDSTVIQVFHSDNDGQSFSAPVNAAPLGPGASLDKEWMAVDNFPGRGRGTVYLMTRDFGSGNGLFLTKSTDGGVTWGPSGGVLVASGNTGNVQGANVVVGPDHALYAFYYDGSTSPAAIRVRKSTDGGNTFGPVVTVTTLSSAGTNGDLGLGGGFRTSGFPQAAVNPLTGALYVVYPNHGAGADKADIFLRTSTDGGNTWSTATRVNDDATANDQWQPTLSVSPEGTRVAVSWYDRRDDPANNLINYYAAVGTVTPTGVSLGPNMRISDTSFPVVIGRDPVVNPVYMGDYDEAQADANFYNMTWGDNRSGNADVRFAKVPLPPSRLGGPVVIAVSPSAGPTTPPLGNLRVTFNVPIDLTSIDPSDFTVTATGGGTASVTRVVPVAGTNNTEFIVWFGVPITHSGTYTITIGPHIRDLAGHEMDQNINGTPGESPGDAKVVTYNIPGPQIIASSPSGAVPPGVTDATVTFSVPMNPGTFTLGQVSFTGPNGTIPITAVTPIAGTNNTQFDIHFAARSAGGTYTMVIGPNIRDAGGNLMDQNGNGTGGEPTDTYTLTFGIPRYQDAGVPINFVELAGDPAAFTIITGADDSSVPVNLGTSTFNLYGTTYTGNNQLFASSNGLISFGTANAEFTNQDLTTDPTQAAIAPLWDDWITGTGSPMVLGKFATFNGSPALIIEWNQVDHYPSSPGAQTFEAVLMLNTGTTLGDIYFEYPDLTTGDGNDNGASATVGIKNAGAQSTTSIDRLLINFDNGGNPLVQSGTAIHISPQLGASPLGSFALPSGGIGPAGRLGPMPPGGLILPPGGGGTPPPASRWPNPPITRAVTIPPATPPSKSAPAGGGGRGALNAPAPSPPPAPSAPPAGGGVIMGVLISDDPPGSLPGAPGSSQRRRGQPNG
jgi:hypothetical protein